MKRLSRIAWLLCATGLTATALTACAADDSELLEPEDQVDDDDGKAEAWDRANNPAFVDSTFLMMAQQLPVKGEIERPPIPSDYWAVAKDSLNAKWDGATSLSPAAKYAKAFGKPNVPNLVSQSNGVKAHEGNKACSKDADCASENDGSICGTAFDGSMKRCIPTWWGICHGWAPYAYMEPAAKKPVERTAPDGTKVTFYPGDIEGLMSMLYTDIESKFISSRCNRGIGDNNAINYDTNGRPREGECRDMNAGSWHVLVGNQIGLRKQGFVLDQTLNYEVWNQPAWKYEITNPVNGGLKEITSAEAMALIGGGASKALLERATLKRGEAKTGSYTATGAGEIMFRLTGTGDADVYVRKGSAPTDSEFDCAPQESTSEETCELTVAAGDVVHWSVKGYGTTSDAALSVAGAGISGDGYAYNPAAKKFYHVKMDFTFIVESAPSREATLASDSDETRHYEYVLEADAQGRILGGEWVGASKQNHPDFAWWATSRPTEVAGISYADMKAINDEAAEIGAGPALGEVVLANAVTLPYTLTKRSLYYALTVEPGVKKVTVNMTGTGDADLYVRKDSYPRIGATNLCESKTPGSSTETCSFNVSPGTYYIRARNKTANTTVTIKAIKE